MKFARILFYTIKLLLLQNVMMKKTVNWRSWHATRTRTKSPKSSVNDSSLLCIDEMTEDEWFGRFNGIAEQLTKLFVLIALMRSQGLITSKECKQFKEFVIRNEDKAAQSVATFDKSKSLFSMRSELRGRLGLPRQRKTDNSPESTKSRADLSFE